MCAAHVGGARNGQRDCGDGPSDDPGPAEQLAGPVAPGCVYLVGAGPGGVGLLTLRAAEVLGACDVVLHDRLVPAEVVKLARPSAQVRYVGKDAGVKSEDMKGQQDDINSQLVDLAKQGLSVCRLKGGDPMIYGRVGEEMQDLADAGVPFEVVPAVTAALAAGADARVPLTFRNAATVLRFCTMNSTTTRDPTFDWSQFAASSTTHVLYMGLAALPGACEQMRAAGVPGSMAMAVVDRASLPAAQVVAGTVDTLPDMVQGRTDLKGPALVLLGEVVALRERLAGRPAPTPPPPQAACAPIMRQLPSLGAAELRSLRGRIDELLAKAEEAPAGGAGRTAGGYPSHTPAKRPAE